ncbi:hypothetical protein VTJ49DRAFT_1054 [Mycothermus thermophilus]|uniref:STB6-like N-terminal domain-containing protein n=1 Tax=Humicola insolens TaxID=85995 RepID=A0ABR3VF17_HUMIN
MDVLGCSHLVPSTAMALKFPFPTAVDGRVHREEELTLARLASHHQRLASHLVSSDQQAAGSTTMGSASPADIPTAIGRRRVVLPDPVAFRFLEEDPSGSVLVVERRRVLPGYELYLVEQWACSRESPTVVIATYTGDLKHSIVVGVLEIPADEKYWPTRVRYYFSAIHEYHARPKETELGELMVTNLSSFPSALTVIPVPEGDIRKHRRIFMVNEDLKRLGCSGRSGLTLTEPTPATQAKFMQMYKTSDRIPIDQAVLELVRLCQVALSLFGMLGEEFIDGLLCDVTEKAVNDWWAKIGSDYFNIEPSDGILGPTTVAALLGTLLGARNRLSYYGAPVSKDAFDTESTKKGIGTFQKSMRMNRTRRLDRETLMKLHRVTAKAAAGDGGWGVQKAVKSTVAEFGGKRGEIVMGMVGGRDKANIGDIETRDLSKFISLAYGERPKWLWHGKPRRTAQEPEQSDPLSTFGRELRDEVGSPGGAVNGRRAQSVPLEEEPERKREDALPASAQSPAVYSPPPTADASADRDALRRTVFKSVAGKVSDARSGLGRIKDAVGGGLRGHAYRPSKDETSETAGGGYSSPIAMLAQSSTSLTSPVTASKVLPWKLKPDDDLSSVPKGHDGSSSVGNGAPSLSSIKDSERTDHALGDITKERTRSTNVSATASDAADAGDMHDFALFGERNPDDLVLLVLQRRRSIDCLTYFNRRPNEARFPRRLSFSAAEDAVLGWAELANLASDDLSTTDTAAAATAAAAAQAEISHRLFTHLQRLQSSLGPWVRSRVCAVSSLSQIIDAQHSEAQALHSAADEACARAQHGAREVVTEERARLAEAVKDVEVLAAKLEYEIGALVSRVAEVEDGVRQFEAQVEDVERRADELKRVLETESWLHWFMRTLTGIGTGPNITRGV